MYGFPGEPLGSEVVVTDGGWVMVSENAFEAVAGDDALSVTVTVTLPLKAV